MITITDYLLGSRPPSQQLGFRHLLDLTEASSEEGLDLKRDTTTQVVDEGTFGISRGATCEFDISYSNPTERKVQHGRRTASS